MLKHLAIIMDGNGRWAKAKGLPRTAGHKQGAENVRNIALEANKMGIEVMTLYAFSTENWKRPPKEVEYLCKIPGIFFKKFIVELMQNNIKVLYIGELEKFPKSTQEVINNAVEQTKNNTGLKLVFATNYGGRREILLAAEHFAQDYKDGKTDLDISEADFEKYLMTKDFPPVDLLVRTSGEVRISNYLLWQLAYSEFSFVDYSWPEFTEEKLHEVIEEFEHRSRRFGGV